ncbi:hypothetical protein CKM354_001043800 [Cercospora kikuchii]|uniref:Extracellular serine-rich protein n=1 Tax=Cercospora kikuchii TaxID=84275 RepID=A0A9P3CQZ9_9PEZI|nr:uncharacterized protein CKM354_001043800 [Cercospora kikuchii]GIZ47344.1 hypothetical protein CKM354_001043800 [Cercospora kikuchii]
MLSKITLASALALAGSAAAQTVHEVRVVEGSLAFEPTSISDVAEGDSIRVSFDPNIPHNAISGSWDSPCQYNSEANVDSGVHTASDGVFVFQVNSTDPAVYYCSVGSHCQAGMAFAINPSGDNTIENYVAGAEGTRSGQPSGDGPTGGVVQAADAPVGGSESGDDNSSSAEPTMSETSSASMPASTEPSATESMASTTELMSPATQTPGSDASGLNSGFAMAGALVAGAAAFAL